jgi:flagellar biosynthesis protein FlhB
LTGSQERTEQPTSKKLRDARKRGQVARSRELTAVGVLLAGATAAYWSAGLVQSRFRMLLEALWTKDSFIPAGPAVFDGIPTAIATSFFTMTAPIMLAALIAAVAVSLVQTRGFVISFEAMRISLSNINPLSGFKKFFSIRSFVELVKSLFKMGIVGYASFSVLLPRRGLLAGLSALQTSELLQITGSLAFEIVIRAGIAMFLLSMLDLLFQKWQHRKDLMMTRQEVKEEHKQSEGNPQIKAKIRSIQRFIARQRMLANVPKASMVITNPTHYAVALHYKHGMEAPTVVAKGMDFLAAKIIKTARKHGVPIIPNPPLARALYKQVKLEQTIPVTLYRAVAKVLAYIYQQKQGLRRS